MFNDEVLNSAPVAELFDKYTNSFDISKNREKLIYCLWSGCCSPVAAGVRCGRCGHRGKRSPLADRGKRSPLWAGRHRNGKKSEGRSANDTPLSVWTSTFASRSTRTQAIITLNPRTSDKIYYLRVSLLVVCVCCFH